MGKHCNPAWPSPKFIAAKLMIVDDAVWWRDRKRGSVAMKARPVGAKPRPDGSRIVSLKFKGRMRTYRLDRVIFALVHKQWPKGRVEVENGQLVDLPRRAKSPGRLGGLKAERARDQAALDALDSGLLRLTHVTEAVGGSRGNVHKRLVKLAAQGLVEPPPRCCPDRSWMLTKAGKEAALVVAPAPTNGHVSSWVHSVNSYCRIESRGHDGNIVRFG
jgi:hypothetical protein